MFGLSLKSQFILLLLIDLNTLLTLFIDPIILFQLIFTFIYNIFKKSFQFQ